MYILKFISYDTYRDVVYYRKTDLSLVLILCRVYSLWELRSLPSFDLCGVPWRLELAKDKLYNVST
jgi:hypothetical protein